MTIAFIDIVNARLDAIAYKRVVDALGKSAGTTHRGRLKALLAEHALASGFDAAELRGRGRTADISRARQAFMLAAHEAGFSLSAIGRFLGRDHTSVRFGIAAAKKRAGK